MLRAIITPTFSGHFCFIEPYLRSFSEYLEDKNFPIYFIINKNEGLSFSKIIHKYEDILNINVIYLEDIFCKYKITESPESALEKYGRLSFQTLKKFYAARYIDADQWLFLDSETMLIKPINMNSIFEEYFSDPHFFVSRVADRQKNFNDGFTYEFLCAVDSLLGKKPDFWSIESYEWFYDRKIFNDMISDLGEPIDIIRNYKMPGKFPNVEGILEALMYYQYILYNNKYDYKVFIIEDELEKFLGKEPYKKLKRTFDNSPFSICGFLEVCSFYIDKSMAEGFSEFLNYHKIRILRIEDPKVNNAEAQVTFVQKSGVSVCPSSQHHIFGINDTKQMRKQILIKENKNYIRLMEHSRKFFQPIKKVLDWLIEPFYVIKYLLRVVNLLIRNRKVVK